MLQFFILAFYMRLLCGTLAAP